MKFRVPLCVKIAASALLLGFVLLRLDFATLWQTLSRYEPAYLGAAAGLSVLGYLLNTLKWKVLLKRLGARVPYAELLRLNYIGMFYNLLLPGQVGGEVVKSVRLARSGVGGGVAAATVVADRVTGLLALLLMGMVGAVLAPAGLGAVPGLPFLLAGLAVLLGGATIVLVAGRGPAVLLMLGQRLHLHRSRLLAKCLGWTERFPVPPQKLSSVAVPVGLSLLFQGLIVYSNYLLCGSLGLGVTYGQLMWVVAGVSILQSLPISLAGIGVREGGYVYLMGLLGVEATTALALSLAVFAIQVAMACAGGVLQLLLVVWPREGRGTARVAGAATSTPLQVQTAKARKSAP